MTEAALDTPVAFLIFNRPEPTQAVFRRIAQQRPQILLVVGDGPRPDRPGEAARVAAARAVIGQVDWPCRVLTCFSDINLGCKRRVSSGLDWVFAQVPEAVILEDDCLPEPSFFAFCREMLTRYRHDQRVGMISGDYFLRRGDAPATSYYFSRYVHIWGWATWGDRWRDSYDVAMEAWTGPDRLAWLEGLLHHPSEAAAWASIFDRVAKGEIDTWDFQWIYANWRMGRIAVAPSVNLISNIGFGPDATHTVQGSGLARLPTEPMAFPLRHPAEVAQARRQDRAEYRRLHSTSLLDRLWRRLDRSLGRVRGNRHG